MDILKLHPSDVCDYISDNRHEFPELEHMTDFEIRCLVFAERRNYTKPIITKQHNNKHVLVIVLAISQIALVVWTLLQPAIGTANMAMAAGSHFIH